STPGLGRRFSLYVPPHESGLESVPSAPALLTANGAHAGADSEIDERTSDDRAQLQPSDRAVLMIASPDQADKMRELVHRLGAKAILVGHPTSGLGFAREHRPQSVVLRGDRHSIETTLRQLT